MSVKKLLLLSNVIAANHQNSSLFTNKGHFGELIGVLSKFHEQYLPLALTRSWNRFQPLIQCEEF